MGTKLADQSYFPGIFSIADLKMNMNGSWKQHHQYEDRNEREMLKRTILAHEAIFRRQVYELHRLYTTQKNLMEQFQMKDSNGFGCSSWNPNAERISKVAGVGSMKKLLDLRLPADLYVDDDDVAEPRESYDKVSLGSSIAAMSNVDGWASAGFCSATSVQGSAFGALLGSRESGSFADFLGMSSTRDEALGRCSSAGKVNSSYTGSCIGFNTNVGTKGGFQPFDTSDRGHSGFYRSGDRGPVSNPLCSMVPGVPSAAATGGASSTAYSRPGGKVPCSLKDGGYRTMSIPAVVSGEPNGVCSGNVLISSDFSSSGWNGSIGLGERTGREHTGCDICWFGNAVACSSSAENGLTDTHPGKLVGPDVGNSGSIADGLATSHASYSASRSNASETGAVKRDYIDLNCALPCADDDDFVEPSPKSTLLAVSPASVPGIVASPPEVDALATAAAESIVAMSKEQVQQESDSEGMLCWLAELAMEMVEGAATESFESMAMKMEEVKIENCAYGPQAPGHRPVRGRMPGRGRSRRRRQHRDFQKDVLRGLSLLSRREVTADLEAFQGLPRAPGQRGGRSKTAAKKRASKSHSTAAIPAAAGRTADGDGGGGGGGSILGWGRKTRRCRQPRCPPDHDLAQ